MTMLCRPRGQPVASVLSPAAAPRLVGAVAWALLGRGAWYHLYVHCRIIILCAGKLSQGFIIVAIVIIIPLSDDTVFTVVPYLQATV